MLLETLLRRRQLLRHCRNRNRVGAVRAPRLGADLSVTADPMDRSIPGRRHDRSGGALTGSVAEPAARPTGHRGEQARRRHQCRRPGGGHCAGRRLHAAVHARHQHHQSVALQKTAIRLSARHRSGGGSCGTAADPGSQPVRSGQNRGRVHRLCKSQPRQNQLSPRSVHAPSAISPSSCLRFRPASRSCAYLIRATRRC